MSSTFANGVLAVALGSGAAVVLLVPFLVVSYRRRGRVTVMWLGGWIAAMIYSMALWTYTLLPLPSSDSYRCVGAQTRLFATVDDIVSYGVGSLGLIVDNPALRQAAFNVALFMPLGVLLRVMLGRGWPTALVLGGVASCAIEVTQYTGVFGLYPCAYRIADVDDLLSNTTGAVLGSLLALLVTWGRRQPHTDPTGPQPVTIVRRLLAMASDALVVVVGEVMIHVGIVVVGGLLPGTDPAVIGAVADAASWSAPFVAQLLWVLVGGRTIGEWAVLVVGRPTRWPAWLSRCVRFLAGVGGWMLLGRFAGDTVWPFLFAAAWLVSVFVTSGHRGFGGWAAGMMLVDSRAERSRMASSTPPAEGVGSHDRQASQDRLPEP